MIRWCYWFFTLVMVKVGFSGHAYFEEKRQAAGPQTLEDKSQQQHVIPLPNTGVYLCVVVMFSSGLCLFAENKLG